MSVWWRGERRGKTVAFIKDLFFRRLHPAERIPSRNCERREMRERREREGWIEEG